jgi:hypothetical protein
VLVERSFILVAFFSSKLFQRLSFYGVGASFGSYIKMFPPCPIGSREFDYVRSWLNSEREYIVAWRTWGSLSIK